MDCVSALSEPFNFVASTTDPVQLQSKFQMHSGSHRALWGFVGKGLLRNGFVACRGLLDVSFAVGQQANIGWPM